MFWHQRESSEQADTPGEGSAQGRAVWRAVESVTRRHGARALLPHLRE